MTPEQFKRVEELFHQAKTLPPDEVRQFVGRNCGDDPVVRAELERLLTAGSLDSMLAKVADFYEQEVDDAVDALSSLLEPIIMSILGILIGGLVVAMYLPIFKMGAAI